MKKRHILSLVLAASMSMAVFSGCSQNSSSSSSTGSGSSSAKVTLTWALWDANKITYYQPLIEAYEKAHPNVTIQTKDLGSTDYTTALGTQLAGGDSGLDVVQIKDIPQYAALTQAGELVDLTDYIKSNNIDTSQYNGIADQLKVSDKLYELPIRDDYWFVYYNKDVFDKAKVAYPTNDMTVTQYDTLARKLTSGSGNNKVYGAYYHDWRSTIQLFGILDGKHTIYDGDYSWMAPYYNMVLKEQTDGVCMDYATIKTSSLTYQGVFENNQIAMLNMGGWYLSSLIKDIKSGKSSAKNFGIASYPHPDGVAAGTTIGTITSAAVPTSSKHQTQALDFLKFITSADGAAIVAGTGNFPAISSDKVIDSIAKMSGFPSDANSKAALKVVKVYLEQALNANASQVNTALNNSHDAIMTKSVTVDAGLKQMASDVKSLLK